MNKESNKINVGNLLDVGVHLGHRVSFWNPKMKPYIYGERAGIHIINLVETAKRFRKAIEDMQKIVKNGGNILFIGTKFSIKDIIREEAIRCGMPYICHRWLGGFLTNWGTIVNSRKKMRDLELICSNSLDKFTKKEGLRYQREYSKLEKTLGGIKDMKGLPDALFVIDVGQEHVAIKEASKLGIPVFGIVDTNNDPDNIDYVIPGNDDSTRSVRLYAQTFADAILEVKLQKKDNDKSSVLNKYSDSDNKNIEGDKSKKSVKRVKSNVNAKNNANSVEKTDIKTED